MNMRDSQGTRKGTPLLWTGFCLNLEMVTSLERVIHWNGKRT